MAEREQPHYLFGVTTRLPGEEILCPVCRVPSGCSLGVRRPETLDTLLGATRDFHGTLEALVLRLHSRPPPGAVIDLSGRGLAAAWVVVALACDRREQYWWNSRVAWDDSAAVYYGVGDSMHYAPYLTARPACLPAADALAAGAADLVRLAELAALLG